MIYRTFKHWCFDRIYETKYSRVDEVNFVEDSLCITWYIPTQVDGISGGLWVSFNVILQILTKGSLKQEYQSFWKYSTNRADFLWRQKEKRNGFFKVASRRAMEFSRIQTRIRLCIANLPNPCFDGNWKSQFILKVIYL